jgi:hypothetical protein
MNPDGTEQINNKGPLEGAFSQGFPGIRGKALPVRAIP